MKAYFLKWLCMFYNTNKKEFLGASKNIWKIKNVLNKIIN